MVSAAVSKFFSAAATAAGEVWTFGACFNGGLGSGAAGTSWSGTPSRVTGPLAQAIAAGGGAAKVTAGATFGACLTRSGAVVVWGKLPGGGPGGSGLGGNLPPLIDIAAGAQHLLMTDGARVWAVGRWVDGTGFEAGSAPVHAPALLLDLEAQGGVAKLKAGSHASAAVAADGGLWAWGRLLDRHHADSVLRNRGGEAAMCDDADWAWSGFGSAAPALVAGLPPVRDVALGGWHALALVD